MIANKESVGVEIAGNEASEIEAGAIALDLVRNMLKHISENEAKDKGIGLTADQVKRHLSSYYPCVGERVVKNMQQWLPDMAEDTSGIEAPGESGISDSVWYLTKTLKRKFSGHKPDAVSAVIEEVREWLPDYGVEWKEERRHEEACQLVLDHVDKMSVEEVEALGKELDCRAAALA